MAKTLWQIVNWDLKPGVAVVVDRETMIEAAKEDHPSLLYWSPHEDDLKAVANKYMRVHPDISFCEKKDDPNRTWRIFRDLTDAPRLAVRRRGLP